METKHNPTQMHAVLAATRLLEMAGVHYHLLIDDLNIFSSAEVEQHVQKSIERLVSHAFQEGRRSAASDNGGSRGKPGHPLSDDRRRFAEEFRGEIDKLEVGQSACFPPRSDLFETIEAQVSFLRGTAMRGIVGRYYAISGHSKRAKELGAVIVIRKA